MAKTGEHTLPVLEAADILPFAERGPHDVRNGLLLRSDFHKLLSLTKPLDCLPLDRITDTPREFAKAMLKVAFTGAS